MANKLTKLINDFNIEADFYLNEMEKYSDDDLNKIPPEGGWSIGQVYNHLTQGTERFHFVKARECLVSDLNLGSGKTMPGKIVFLIGGFPPSKIKVPPSPQYTPTVPENKTKLASELNGLKNSFSEIALMIDESNTKGKTPHPALGFLTATEWLKLVIMHFKHHRRQKQRLDTYLGK